MVVHCTICSHTSEHPYCLPLDLLLFSFTLSEMRGLELYADTGETSKQSENRPRRMNQNSYKQNCEDLGMSRNPSGEGGWDSAHALCAGMEVAEQGKIRKAELKRVWQLCWGCQKRIVGHGSDPKGCKGIRMTKNVQNLSQQARTAEIFGQRTSRALWQGLASILKLQQTIYRHPYLPGSEHPAPCAASGPCQRHCTVPAAWVPASGERSGGQRPACDLAPAAVRVTRCAQPAPGWWHAKPGSGWLLWRSVAKRTNKRQTAIAALGAERLGALQRVAEGWCPLGQGGFFWPARKTSAGPTVLGVPDPCVMHKLVLPVAWSCFFFNVFLRLGALA